MLRRQLAGGTVAANARTHACCSECAANLDRRVATAGGDVVGAGYR